MKKKIAQQKMTAQLVIIVFLVEKNLQKDGLKMPPIQSKQCDKIRTQLKKRILLLKSYKSGSQENARSKKVKRTR